MNIARQLLLEYVRDKEIQKSGPKLLQALSNDTHFNSNLENLDDQGKINSLLDQLDQIDPTQNNQYVRWLIREYTRGSFKVEDSQRVQNVLKQFISVQKRLDKKDLNQYKFHDLEDTMDKIFSPDIDQSNDNEDFPDGSKVLYNGPLGWLVIPESEEASCELGSGTKWCTAADEKNMFNDYSNDGPLYIWRDNQEGGAKYQFHFETNSFMDAKDRSISTEKLNYFRTEHPVIKKLFKMKEAEIAKDPKRAYRYVIDIIKGRFPEGEPAIAKDPQLAYAYAKNIIKGRFPEGEPEIVDDPEWAYWYTRYIIKGRWKEAEPVIAKDPMHASLYAKDVIKGRWPEAESVIATDPDWANWYARYVIEGRFPEAETVIAKDPDLAYEYAINIMHDPDFWKKRNKQRNS